MQSEEFNEKFNALIEDVKVIKQSVNKIDELVDGYSSLQKENESLRKRIEVLEDEKGKIKKRLSESEQYSRRENIIITGVPREQKENLRKLVNQIAEMLNVRLFEYDICTTHRLSNKGDTPAIIVRMNNRDKKNAMIKAGRRRELSTRDLGWKTDERIFISDHLTKETGELLLAAKEKLRNTGLVKFVWPSEGQVLIRENENARITRIEDLNHLEEIAEMLQREYDEQSSEGEKEDNVEETKERETNVEEAESGREEGGAERKDRGNKKKRPTKAENERYQKKGHQKQQKPITNYILRKQQSIRNYRS